MREPLNSTGFKISMLEFSPKNLSRVGRVVAWSFLFLILAVFALTTNYMGVATFAYCCLILGLIERKNKNFHMSLMLTGMLTDIMIVLILETTRSAIGTATGTALTPIQYTHILVSLLAVIFYVPVIVHGYWLVDKGSNPTKRSRHITLGITAFVLRTIGWFTMFSFLGFSA